MNMLQFSNILETGLYIGIYSVFINLETLNEHGQSQECKCFKPTFIGEVDSVVGATDAEFIKTHRKMGLNQCLYKVFFFFF